MSNLLQRSTARKRRSSPTTNARHIPVAVGFRTPSTPPMPLSPSMTGGIGLVPIAASPAAGWLWIASAVRLGSTALNLRPGTPSQQRGRRHDPEATA